MNEDTGQWIQFPAEPWNEIMPDMWMGGMYFGPSMTACAPEDQFDVVVSMAGRGGIFTRVNSETVTRHNFFIDDGQLGPGEMALALEAAELVSEYWAEDNRILVRCNMGLNRSGLIVALALVDHGNDAQKVIDRIREKRSPNALCNPWFVKYILDFPGFKQ